VTKSRDFGCVGIIPEFGMIPELWYNAESTDFLIHSFGKIE